MTCKYTFINEKGEPEEITGKAAFKAFLATRGLQLFGIAPTVAQAKENTNADQTQAIGSAGNRALEGAPADQVRGTEAGGNAERGGAEGGGNDAGRASQPDGTGIAGRGGLGNGAGEVPVPAGRGRGQRGSGGQRRVQAEPGTEQADARPVGDQRQQEITDAKETAPAGDYRITDLTRLGEGGQKTKYRNNVAAIRLLNDLQATGRQATAAEQDILARYVGWGGLAQAFDSTNKDWANEHAELKSLLTPEEWATAEESTQYAHYTSQEMIGGIYDALKHLGFTGGKIVEPGSGVGNFIGLMPEDMRAASRFTAVERERIAGGIAKMLYPNQNVQQQDFRKFNAQDGYFDAAIGNPPFSATTLTDLSGRKHLSGLSIHNYFFAKSIDMLREGGVLAMVVTNSFLDAKGDKARRYIGERAQFLGAIRLPNNAFSKNANTEVTTDIIFLKKRPESEWGSKAAKEDLKRWQSLGTVPDARGGEAIPINQYFIDNPSMMLGSMERSGSMYRADKPALIAAPGQDTAALMREAIARLPASAYEAAVVKNTAAMQDAAVVALDDGAKVDVGGHYLKGDRLFVRLPDIAGEGRAIEITPTTKISEKRDLGKNGFERVKALAEMRVTVRQLLAAEIADHADMEALRSTLNTQYDAYVKKHGYINGRSSVQLFGDDPDFPLLASLEHGYDPGIGDAAAKAQGIKPVPASAKKAPIFTRRVIERHEEITKAETPEDALMISIAERGQIDSDYIGNLLGRDGAEVLKELAQGDKPVLFLDPATGGYALRDAYLSGNVRKKLEQAKAAGMFKNVGELERVIPEDIPAHEISGKLGAPWIPTATYEDFAKEIFGDGTKANITYVPAMSSYVTKIQPGSEVANTNTYGTPRMEATAILEALMNSREIKVGYYEEDPVTRSRRFVLEKEPTDEANDKAREIKEKFGDWLFADPDRSQKMQRAYNDAVNNYVTRVFDGSMMNFPGKVPDAIIKLRRHQRNAVARIVQDGRALLDHVVGAGKTYTVIAAAMELKRTGLAKKPMIVVPNHLVKQWASDFYRLYPGANILTATKKDFEKANRRKFLAKIATGNWDAVIIAHSSFGFIKPDGEFEIRFNKERIQEVVDAIQALKDEKDQTSKRTVKQLAKMKEGLENRLASLRDKPMDDLLDFGQLGVDQLFVDEAHLFKNLMFVTKMQNVRGLGQAKGSQRAYDMFIKTHQLYEKSGNGRGVVFATGTPVSNSLAEMYHMLRYLAPETLKDSNQFTFDAWAKTFADVEQVWMQALSGDGYKASNRMSVFVNTPELLRVYDQVADTVTIDDIKTAYSEENGGKEFPIPALKGGRRAPVSIPRSQDQTDYMEEIAKRAKALEQRKGKPQKGDDNMLSIMGDARKSAMDIRMVRFDIKERDPNGRIAIAARNILDRYRQFNDVQGTQLVFSDMGTPKKHAQKELKEYNELTEQAAPLSDESIVAMADLGDEDAQAKLEKAEEAQRKLDAKGQDWMDAIQAAMRGFSVYDDLKDALVEQGIPESEIAFIHDYNTDDQKAALFRAVNEGKVRVLMGSTEKMGAGTNVQQRLVALHHLDVPWKPSDIEQREGRIIRQGNLFSTPPTEGVPNPLYRPDFEAEVMAYATQDTLDLFMWQTQEKKLSMISQLRTGNVGREVDNAFEEMQMSAGEMQAAATSNPYLLEEIQLKDKVKKLERQKRSFDGQKNDLENRKRKAERDLREIPSKVEAAKKIEAEALKTLAEIRGHFATLEATVNGETIKGAAAIRAALREAVQAAPMTEKDGKNVREIKIEFNGKEYKSESGLAEATLKALGDVAEVAFTLPNGETLYRSSAAAAEIADRLGQIEGDEIVKIGSVGAFDVEAMRDRSSYEMTVLQKGTEVGSFTIRSEGDSVGELRGVPGRVIDMIRNIEGTSAYYARGLDDAKRTLADIESKPAAGAWPGEADLKKAREDYRAVLRKLAERSEKEDDAPAFRRGDGEGMQVSTVEQIAAVVAQSWAESPEIVVVQDMQDQRIPQAVRDVDTEQREQGATGTPKGFYVGGKVFVVASAAKSPADVVETILHEALGHYGLRKTFGKALAGILDEIAKRRVDDVAKMAVKYGLKPKSVADTESAATIFASMTPQQRRRAAEEVLSFMAQNRPNAGFVKQAISAIRQWIRERFPKLAESMALTDNDILVNYLMPARAFVEDGGVRAAKGVSDDVPAFSRSGDNITAPTDSEVSKWFSDKLTKAMPKIVRWAPLRLLLTEVARDLPSAQAFLKTKQKMDATRDQWHSKVATVADRWHKFAALNRKENEELMDVMHESTLAQVDPAESFVSLMTERDFDTLSNENASETAREVAINKMAQDGERQRAYDDLQKRFNALSEKAQALYRTVRDSYKEMNAEFDRVLLVNLQKALDTAILQAEREHKKELVRIDDEGLTGDARKEAIAAADKKLKKAKVMGSANTAYRMREMRAKFETNTLAGPYFPLFRTGEYYVTVRNEAGKVLSFSRFEDPTDQRRFAEEAAKVKGQKVERGVLDNMDKMRSMIDPTFVADVEVILDGSGAPDSVKDAVWQRFLETMPDVSLRKNRIHRKGRAGYNADALRAYAHHMFHGAHQLARTEYAIDLKNHIDEASMEASTAKNPERAKHVVNEMRNHIGHIMNPSGHWLQHGISQAAFIYHLSMSPASALNNAAQTVFMGVPILGAFSGSSLSAGAALMRTMKEFALGRGHILNNKKLAGDERNALEQAYKIGLIERTQSHDLASVAESGAEYRPVREKVMRVISWQFHHVERFNREVTFLAAYRLAKEKGLNNEAAIDKAAELTWKTHFDYQNSSRPSIMHSSTAKTLLIFRNFQVNMLFRLFRDTHQALNGETKEVRREAIHQLAGMTGLMLMGAGMRGVWGFGIVMAIASLFYGDDEEGPEETLKKGLVNTLGETAAKYLLDGIPGAAFGVSLSERIGMPDLWFRSPDKQLEGKDAYFYWVEQVLGAGFAPFANAFTGWKMAQEGNVYRGLETVMPKFVKDAMRSARYATEGVQTLGGDPVIKELKPQDILKQAIGYTPAVVAERFETNRNLMNRQQAILDKRQSAMDGYEKAIRSRDPEKIDKAVNEVIEFSKKHPEKGIMPQQLANSMRTRERNRALAEGGVFLDRRLNHSLRSNAAPMLYDYED